MELESVLQQDFAFPGTYHQVMEHFSWPHLGLRVDGLEDVSLPLNDKNARAIHALADSSKNGSGRSFSELGNGFSFIKPEWNIWLQRRMREEVLRKVLPEDCPVTFKLSKLMLWEADAEYVRLIFFTLTTDSRSAFQVPRNVYGKLSPVDSGEPDYHVG